MAVVAGYLPVEIKGEFDETIYAQHDDYDDAGYGANGIHRWNNGGACRGALHTGRPYRIQTAALDVPWRHGIWHILSGRSDHGFDTWRCSINQLWRPKTV